MAKTAQKLVGKNANEIRRNPMAGCLSHGAYQPRIVRAAKGKGSYRRRDKHVGKGW